MNNYQEKKQKFPFSTKVIWGGFSLLNIVIFILFSSYDFSFILTLAVSIQSFGFGMVYFTIKKTGDVQGISWNTFCSCGLALLGRLSSILVYEGYLPLDASGDYVYKLFEILSLIFCIGILNMMRGSLTRSHQEQFEILKWYYLAPPALILAILIHPGLNQYSPLDILWTFGIYLESFALLPQVFLFNKKDEIEDHTSNFVITQVLSKTLTFIFWVTSFQELNINQNKRTYSVAPFYSGYCVIGAQLVQIFLTTDFLFLYLKSVKTGIPMARLPH